jgi:hypothetical protein
MHCALWQAKNHMLTPCLVAAFGCHLLINLLLLPVMPLQVPNAV